MVTDADPANADNADEDTPSATAKKLKELESGGLRVFIGARTLEYDMALAGNAEMMAEVYEGIRPRKGAAMRCALAEATDPEEEADLFATHFDGRDKAVFAQALAEAIVQNDHCFSVPDYIADGIRHVTQTNRCPRRRRRRRNPR